MFYKVSNGGTTYDISTEYPGRNQTFKASKSAKILVYSCYIYGNNAEPTFHHSPHYHNYNTERSRTYIFLNVSANENILTFQNGSLPYNTTGNVQEATYIN